MTPSFRGLAVAAVGFAMLGCSPQPGRSLPPPDPTTRATTTAAPAMPPPTRPEWELVTVAGNGALVDVIGDGAGYVAVGYESWESPSRSTVMTSSDGLTWTAVPADESLERGRMTAVADGPAGFVAVGRPCADGRCIGTGAWTSKDAVEWLPVDDRGLGQPDLTSVTLFDGHYVAGGSSGGSTAIFMSPDARTWREVTFGTDVELTGSDSRGQRSVLALAAVEGAIVALVDGLEGTDVWRSSDGLAWERVAGLASSHARAIVGTEDGWVVGGWATSADGAETARVWTSTDGYAWNEPVELGPGQVVGVESSGGVTLAVGVGPDGLPTTWSSANRVTWRREWLPTGALAGGGASRAIGDDGGWLIVGWVGGTNAPTRAAVWRGGR